MKTKLTLALVALITGTAFGSMPAAMPEFKNAKQLAEWRAEVTAQSEKEAGTAQDPAFYTGRPYVESSGGYAFKYRSYNPELARWTSEDPSGFPDGSNSQIYINNMATNAFDYLGLAQVKVMGNYTMTATWTEQQGFNLDPSFRLAFPWSVSVSVNPGYDWSKIGEIFTSKTAGLYPQDAIAPGGYTWVPETIKDNVSNRAEANPTYGSNYQIFSHSTTYISPSYQVYTEDHYNTRRDGSQSVTFTWSRMATE